MKKVAHSVVLILVAFIAAPSHGADPLVLYDNFNKSLLINPLKWYGYEWYTNNAGREASRGIQGGKLNLVYRAYGNRVSNDGVSYGATRVAFANSGAVTAVKATVRVNKYEITGCSANPAVADTRVRIGGSFFHTGDPIPGSSVNDVGAQIGLRRTSNSTDPPDVLRVYAWVYQCLDRDCINAKGLGDEDLGTVAVGKTAVLQLAWEPEQSRFVFTRDKAAPISVVYSVPNTSPPTFGAKRLDAIMRPANCNSGSPSTAYIDAYFDNVYVNQAAAQLFVDSDSQPSGVVTDEAGETSTTADAIDGM